MWKTENVKPVASPYLIEVAPVFTTPPVFLINTQNLINLDENIKEMTALSVTKLTFNSSALWTVNNYFFRWVSIDGSFVSNGVIDNNINSWYYTANVLDDTRQLAPLYYASPNLQLQLELSLSGINNYNQIQHLLQSDDLSEIRWNDLRVTKDYLKDASYNKVQLNLIYNFNKDNNTFIHKKTTIPLFYISFQESLTSEDMVDIRNIIFNNKVYSRVFSFDQIKSNNFILSTTGVIVI